MPAISTRPPIPAGPDETTLVAQAKHDRHAFALLYHRYDGHYGVITPAETGRGGEV